MTPAVAGAVYVVWRRALYGGVAGTATGYDAIGRRDSRGAGQTAVGQAGVWTATGGADGTDRNLGGSYGVGVGTAG